MTFLELAQKVLEEIKKPLTANEIWEFGVKKDYDKQLNSKGKTPWATLGARIYTDERDNSNTIFAVIGKRPKRFYLKNPDQFQLILLLIHKKLPGNYVS